MPGDGRFVKGQTPWNKGEQIVKVCPKCGTQFSVQPSLCRVTCCSRRCARLGGTSGMKGKKTSAEAREKQRLAKLGIRGEVHWNWRGGKRSERSRAMARDEYRQWRDAVFRRDAFTCQECGKRGVLLHADHILPWATHIDRRFDVSNGRSLCAPCHYETPSFPKRLIPIADR